MNKKGFVSVHAGMFFVIGLIIGALVAYYLITKGILPVTIPTT